MELAAMVKRWHECSNGGKQHNNGEKRQTNLPKSQSQLARPNQALIKWLSAQHVSQNT